MQEDKDIENILGLTPEQIGSLTDEERVQVSKHLRAVKLRQGDPEKINSNGPFFSYGPPPPLPERVQEMHLQNWAETQRRKRQEARRNWWRNLFGLGRSR